MIECPWNSDHTGGCAWIAELGNGAITAGCQHNGCAGRGWEDLRRLKEPGYAERVDRRNGGGPVHGEHHADTLPEEPPWLADGAEDGTYRHPRVDRPPSGRDHRRAGSTAA